MAVNSKTIYYNKRTALGNGISNNADLKIAMRIYKKIKRVHDLAAKILNQESMNLVRGERRELKEVLVTLQAYKDAPKVVEKLYKETM